MGPWSRRCRHTLPDSRSRGPSLKPDGGAFFNPFPLFNAAASKVTAVNLDAQRLAGVAALTAQNLGEGMAGVNDGLTTVVFGGDWDDDDLGGGNAGRQYQPVVIGVCHDQGADEAVWKHPMRWCGRAVGCRRVQRS